MAQKFRRQSNLLQCSLIGIATLSTCLLSEVRTPNSTVTLKFLAARISVTLFQTQNAVAGLNT